MKKTVKVGLIGCGFMGTMHANCYNALKNVKVTAVADLREDKAQALAALSKAKIYSDGKDLIENAEVDIIDICLPTYLHTAYALLAMEKAPYVFIEKPVAFDKKECDLLEKKAKETGCNVQVGQVIRFWDEYVKLKEIIDSKIYGEVVNASFHRISPLPTWGWENWLLDVNKSGGACQDLHIHDVDYVISVFGLPNKAKTLRNVTGDKNSYGSTHMYYDNFVVTTESTWDLPGSFPFNAGFRVKFEKAAVELAGGKLNVFTDEGVSEAKIDKIDLGVDGGGNISDLGGYYNELLYFTDKAREGSKIERATLSDGVTSLKFLLKQIKK